MLHHEEVSLAKQVQTGAIKSTVSFFACARLGVLAAIGVVAASKSVESSLAAVPLLVMPMSALLLWSWERVSNAVLNGILFPIIDALMAGVLCLVSLVKLDAPALGGAYFLLSVVLMGGRPILSMGCRVVYGCGSCCCAGGKVRPLFVVAL